MKEVANNVRTGILEEAIRVLGNRGITHGGIKQNMEHTAALWSAYLGVPVSSVDVCQMMVLLKCSRIKCGDATHKDHMTDQCGYAAISGELGAVDE